MKMALLLSLFFISISIVLLGQENQEVRILSLKKERLTKTIQSLTDSLEQVNKRIEILKKEEFKITGYQVKAIIEKDTDVANNSNRDSKLGKFLLGDTVTLFGYEWYQFQATNAKLTGFISTRSVVQTDEVKDFEKIMELKEIETRKEKRDAELREKQELEKLLLRQTNEQIVKSNEQRAKSIREKFKNYSQDIIRKIIDRYYWIGMTEEMALYSLGQPEKINSSVGSWGTKNQWVYENIYLYFDNNKLTSYQTTK